MRLITRIVSVVVLAVLLVAACGSEDGSESDTGSMPDDSKTAFAPGLEPNPFLGPRWMAAMHGDSGSSDTTGLSGPGTGPISVAPIELGAVCPAVLIGGDGYPVVLCTRIADVRPVVHLLDPMTGSSLASMEMVAGNLFSGVYGYLDDEDRMVLADGASNLLRIGHHRDGSGWSLAVDERTSLAGSIPDGDTVTSVAPGYEGGVWFATTAATVGVADTSSGSVQAITLPAGEQVANSISTGPDGMAVATDHAVYLVARDDEGRPEVRWRHPYDRGPARKPGQLSWGTGSTPTFFGPTDGADYVAVVDNADPEVHLLVIDVAGADAGQELCALEVLHAGGPGSENSPIGAGRTVVIASTYGYAYPRLPEGAEPSEPAAAPFEGGMTRVDVRPDGSGCDVVWDTTVGSAAVPKLSTADDTVITMTRHAATGADGDGGDTFAYAAISVETGEVLAEHDLGPAAGDPLQLAGTTGPNGVLYQGTVGPIMRITAQEGNGAPGGVEP